MKLSKLLFISIFLLPSYQAFGKWKLQQKLDNNHSVYKSGNESYLAVTLEDNQKNNLNLINQNFMKRIEKGKRSALTYINIKNWKANNYTIKREKKNMVNLSFYGSYTNRENKTVYFKEIHLYTPQKSFQLLLSNENRNKLKQDLTSNLLSHFRKKHDF